GWRCRRARCGCSALRAFPRTGCRYRLDLKDSHRSAGLAARKEGEPGDTEDERPEHDASCYRQRLHLNLPPPHAGSVVGASSLRPPLSLSMAGTRADLVSRGLCLVGLGLLLRLRVDRLDAMQQIDRVIELRVFGFVRRDVG